MRTCLKSLLVMAIGTLSASCVSAESEQTGWTDLSRSGGEGVFVEKCGMCHRPGGMGTALLARRYEGDLALLENRTDLQPAFIRTVVRNGFTNMLPLSRGEVSDDQLELITDYLAGED